MRIIVASSNVFHRELSSFILSEAGYTIYECSDGATFLQYVNQVQPDMVLLDTRLSGGDTLDFARQARQQSGVPIMFLTNSSFTGALQTLFACGDDYLVWPYQPEDLLAHVDALLHHRPVHVAAPSVPVSH